MPHALAIPNAISDLPTTVRAAGPRLARRVRAEAPRIRRRAVEYAPLLGFAALTAGAAALGARFNPTPRRNPRTALWYATRRKSRLSPPNAAYGPTWAALYGLYALAGWRVWRAEASSHRTHALGWWTAQLGLNAAWSPLFFGARRPGLALADVGAMLATAGLFTEAARKTDRRAAWLMAPYLGWTAFAAYLNSVVVRRNR